VVEELLKAGANINLQNSLGETPLVVAKGEGHLRIMKKLMNAGADK
jgi:ankyrin repeat protein